MNEQRIAIIADSGTDTPADFIAQHDIRVIPLRINYSDGTAYESGVDISVEEVVRRLIQKSLRPLFPHP